MGKTFVAIGSLMMIASPISCISNQVGAGGALFIGGLVVFVIGRLMQE